MPKKTQLFFPAKSARPGSKERHQKDILKLKPNLSILKFLKTQNKDITNLDRTNWTRNLHFDDKINVFACLRNCKKLNNLKIHIEDVELYQSDQSHIWLKGTVLSKVLPKTTIKDLTIDYCDVAKIVYNHAWFSWLQDVPLDVKI